MPDPEGRATDLVHCQESILSCKREESGENRVPSSLSTGHTVTSVLDQQLSPVDESSLCSVSPLSSAPICRQFWRSGNYDDTICSKSSLPKGTNYLHVHPKFLHSNATSHKWAFGAIAELLDNAIDEVQNGATFVMIDKTWNSRDGSPALLIQDDGGGMDPDAMRQCMSFGFSEKKSKVAIGQYGNGFKTSSMRLGSDVIVFSRHIKNRKLTQTIGLLSYTYLTQTGHDRIVVPMVDYEFNAQTNTWNSLNNVQHQSSNLSLLLQWSPYTSKDKLLKEFDDIGNHGTKIIVFNLWHSNDGTLELDFEADPEDICISGEGIGRGKGSSKKTLNEQHLANRLRFSLRAYLSVLYLRVPERFHILLRGQEIEYYSIASDLKFRECILYRPQSGAGYREVEVITTIGFLKEAPEVNIHGFNVYHKNRLILPFWHVVSYSDSRGRGVVGVLEANFIEPTHNKQDFEKTSVFQKLEQRLKDMTFEYWDYHCGLIGYQVKKKPRMMACQATPDFVRDHGVHQPVLLKKGPSAPSSAGPYLSHVAVQHPTIDLPRLLGNKPRRSTSHGPVKRKEHEHFLGSDNLKMHVGITGNKMVSDKEILHGDNYSTELEKPEAACFIEENKQLHARCLEHVKIVDELKLKVAQLRVELNESQSEYSRFLAEAKLLGKIKEEKPM